MDKKAIAILAPAMLLFLLLSAPVGSDPITVVTDEDRIFATIYYRENEGIYIDGVASNVMILGKNIPIKWGYEKETIEVPYKQAYMPFWFEHSLPNTMPPIVLDPCAGSLQFTTTYPADTEFLWDYNVRLPNYDYGEDSAECTNPFDEKHCYISSEFGETLKHCDVSLANNTCTWYLPVFNGTYTMQPKAKWRSLSGLDTCPLEANKKYYFRHSATIPVGSTIVFDVNMAFNLPVLGEFVFIIPEPSWVSTAAEDYNTGTGYDFNWTKVTGDANVMPTGSDRVYVEQDQAFYDNNLMGYWRFDDVNADGSGVLDDTNNSNDGLLLNGADMSRWGMWDTNAAYLNGGDDFIDVPDIPLTASFTLAFWYYTTNQGQTGMIFGEDSGTTAGQTPKIGVHDGKFFARMITNGAGDNSIALPGQGQWHHVVFTRDAANKVDLYIDGGAANRLFSDAAQATTWTLDVIGKNGIGAGQEFDGRIEEVKVYKGALTFDQIKQDYNAWMQSHYYSPIKDAGEAVNWDTIKWFEDVDQNNSLSVDYRGCSASDCSTAGTWMTGLRGGYTTHSNIYADSNRYLQYRVNFDTNNENWNPTRLSGITADRGMFAKLNTMTVEYSSITADSCTCDTSGHWQIVNGDTCTLTGTCSMSGGNLHISSGSLLITSSGVLNVPLGYQVVIEDGQHLYIEDGGQLVINK